MPQNQRKHPRPGLVLDVDRTTPPILFHHGEGFRMEKLPADDLELYTQQNRYQELQTLTPLFVMH